MKKIIIQILVCISIIYLATYKSFAEEKKIGGFVSQGFLQTNKNNYMGDTHDGTFQFNEMGVFIKSSIPGNITVGLQFFARDLGEVGNNEVVINWAFAEKKWTEYLGIRAGLLKFPYGFYNETRDMDFLRVPIFLPQSFYNEWLRDGNNSFNAIEIFGTVGIGPAGYLQYQIMDGETNVSSSSGTAKFATDVIGNLDEIIKFTYENIFVSSVTWFPPLDGLGIKCDYIQQTFTMEGLKNDMAVSVKNPDMAVINVSTQYIWGKFVFSAELSIFDISTEVYIDTPGGIDINEDEIKSMGYYTGFSYSLTEKFQIGAYYAKYENDEDKSGPQNELNDICLSARYDIEENWVIKVECHRMDGLFGVEAEKPNGSMDKDWNLYAAKLTYFF